MAMPRLWMLFRALGDVKMITATVSFGLPMNWRILRFVVFARIVMVLVWRERRTLGITQSEIGDKTVSKDSVEDLGSSLGYSPGPWQYGMYKMQPTVFDSHGNGTVPIATCHDWTTGNVKSNARLMAASPQMYEALKKAKEVLITEFSYRTFMANFPEVEEAIRVAEGRNPFDE
jgi:hypothetical protein